MIVVLVVLLHEMNYLRGELTCLACSDSPLPRDCPYTTICGLHEVCYTNSYITTFGTIKYEMGCKDSQQCSSGVHSIRASENLLVCSECCNGTLCNAGLCGQTGISTLTTGTRGPICYSCAQQLFPHSCYMIKECGRDEECMLSRFESQMGHDLIYKTDCIKRTMCDENYHRLIGPWSLIGKRHSEQNRRYSGDTDHCVYKCCDTDLCNSDCSGTRVIFHANATESSTTTPTSSDTPSKTTLTTTNEHSTNTVMKDSSALMQPIHASTPVRTPHAGTSTPVHTTNAISPLHSTHASTAHDLETHTTHIIVGSASSTHINSPHIDTTHAKTTHQQTTHQQTTHQQTTHQQTTHQQTTHPSTTLAVTSHGQTSVTGPTAYFCEDQEDCSHYLPYCVPNEAWAKTYCAKTCGICDFDPRKPCIDTGTCSSLELCTSSRAWSMEYCPKFCGFCNSSG